MKKFSVFAALCLSVLLLIGGCGVPDGAEKESSSQTEETKLSDKGEGSGEVGSVENDKENEKEEQKENGKDPQTEASSGTSATPTKPSPSQNASEPTPHVHKYRTTVIAPTCSKRGYTQHKCACGDSYNDTFVKRLDHTYGEWKVTVRPTYTAEGKKEKNCTVCGSTITGAVRKLVNIPAEMDRIVVLVNQERQAAGLEPLSVRTDLKALAGERAVEISTLFSHDRPAGKTDIYEILFGTGYHLGGENIARGQRSAEEVVSDWMASGGHRQNILKPSYKWIGIGGYYSEENGGTYHWVQIFGG